MISTATSRRKATPFTYKKVYQIIKLLGGFNVTDMFQIKYIMSLQGYLKLLSANRRKELYSAYFIYQDLYDSSTADRLQ